MHLPFEPPPCLHNHTVRLRLLGADDFEALHAVAADPLIWAQHPNPNRYQREVFANYFQGALESRGAYRVFDAATDELIGSSRYYDYDAAARSVAIGYTFLARHCWGGRYNRALKTLMLEHAFTIVDKVIFHVGENNQRSRIAMQRLGGRLVGEAPVAYYGETSQTNVIYEITRQDWPGVSGA